MPKITARILLTALSCLAGLYAIYTFGLDSEIPTRWDLNGNVTDQSSPLLAFGILPLVQVILLIVIAKLHVIEPRGENLEKSWKAVTAIMTAVFALLTAIQLLILSAAAGLYRPGSTAIFVGMGLMLCVIGNYSGKLHSTFFVGIRTPWTLSSESVWRQTHRLAGKLLFTAGLVLLILPLLIPTDGLQPLLILVIGASVIIPVGYSWLAWRREQRSI